MPDFVPQSEPDLLVFLKNFAAKAQPYATAAGVPAPETTALIDRIGPYCDDSQTLENDRATMQQRTLKRHDARKAILTDVRALAGRIKAAPGGAAAAEDLQVMGSSDETERRDNTPVATVKASTQGPVVGFTNPTRQGVNVYRQVMGVDAKPQFLARDTRSPYVDTEVFEKPVKLSYHVVAVLNDEEVGEPSAAVTITAGG